MKTLKWNQIKVGQVIRIEEMFNDPTGKPSTYRVRVTELNVNRYDAESFSVYGDFQHYNRSTGKYKTYPLKGRFYPFHCKSLNLLNKKSFK